MDDRANYIKKLEEISHITADEAKRLLVEEVQNDLKAEIAKEIKEAEAEAKASAHKKAQEILADAIKHGALDFLPEYTLSVVKIEDEDMKGRIIGKEGRNIRSFVKLRPFSFCSFRKLLILFCKGVASLLQCSRTASVVLVPI